MITVVLIVLLVAFLALFGRQLAAGYGRWLTTSPLGWLWTLLGALLILGAVSPGALRAIGNALSQALAAALTPFVPLIGLGLVILFFKMIFSSGGRNGKRNR